MVVVPDASVILKWVLQPEDEPDVPRALRLLGDYRARRLEIRVPSLWRYEAGNILGLKYPELAAEAMESLLAVGIAEEVLDREFCLAVLQFMREIKGVTFYDTSYHVLALRLGGTCITADRDYARKTRRKGHIVLLSEWVPPTQPG